MDNAVYIKEMKNLKNKTDVRLLSNEKPLKWTLKPKYIPQKLFDNNFVAICKQQSYININVNIRF